MRNTLHKLPRLFALFAALVVAAQAQTTPEQLYDQLATVELDPASVVSFRNGSLDTEDLHLSFNQGVLIFTRPVAGRITGALFVGDGEVLIIPPAQDERQSMALFTGTAVLNERFTAAYLRFDSSEVAQKLRQSGRATSEGPEKAQQYAAFAKSLALPDALGLTAIFTGEGRNDSRLHARIVGQKLGTFDVVLDSTSEEQVTIAQYKQTGTTSFIDVWASFCFRKRRDRDGNCKAVASDLALLAYHIDTTVTPPHSIDSHVTIRFKALESGQRLAMFNLGQELKITSAAMNGQPLPVIAPASNGSRLGDAFAVVMPSPMRGGTEYEISVRYSGEILKDAGGGLVYVQERGRWYPSRGINMAQFDLTFHYPAGWQLLATGELKETRADGTEQYSRWTTNRPLPFAGFNLGHYESVKLPETPGLPSIESFASRSVESALQQPAAPTFAPPTLHRQRPQFLALPPVSVPNPAKNALAVAQQAAQTIRFLQPKIGQFPFRSLRVTQLPGYDSQGFPGLIYLSSMVFLNPQERWRGRIPPEDFAPEILYSRVMAAHETAHQWWGDKVAWNSYREQWLCEAIANYLALMQLEVDSPEYFASVLDSYRTDLITPQEGSGAKLKDAGAVTLGFRLSSSKFPDAYDAVAYGRGTWLIHMLREMLRDAAAHPSSAVRKRRTERKADIQKPAADPDAAFFSVLRTLQEKFDGRSMTTADLKQAFEAALPASLRFEGKPSLDWFFESWVSSTHVPEIELDSVRFIKGAAPAVSFKIRQSQCPDSVVTSLPLYVETKDGKLTFFKRVFAEGNETEFKFPVPVGATKLLLDPYRTVLRQ